MTAPARRDTSDNRIDESSRGNGLATRSTRNSTPTPRSSGTMSSGSSCAIGCAPATTASSPIPATISSSSSPPNSAIVVRGQRRHRAGPRQCLPASRLAGLRRRSGHAKFFVCPYHAWSYGLDGSLRAARHMPEGFDTASHGLKPIQVRVVQGLIFVTFAAQPLGLAASRGDGERLLRPLWLGAGAHRPSRDLQDRRELEARRRELPRMLPLRPVASGILEAPRARAADGADREAQRADGGAGRGARPRHPRPRPLGRVADGQGSGLRLPLRPL